MIYHLRFHQWVRFDTRVVLVGDLFLFLLLSCAIIIISQSVSRWKTRREIRLLKETKKITQYEHLRLFHDCIKGKLYQLELKEWNFRALHVLNKSPEGTWWIYDRNEFVNFEKEQFSLRQNAIAHPISRWYNAKFNYLQISSKFGDLIFLAKTH